MHYFQNPQTDRQTYIHTYIHTDIQTDIHTEEWGESHTTARCASAISTEWVE